MVSPPVRLGTLLLSEVVPERASQSRSWNSQQYWGYLRQWVPPCLAQNQPLILQWVNGVLVYGMVHRSMGGVMCCGSSHGWGHLLLGHSLWGVKNGVTPVTMGSPVLRRLAN